MSGLKFQWKRSSTGGIGYLNIAGKRFGKLLVLHRAKRRNKHGQRLWVCRCEPRFGGCGRRKRLLAHELCSGGSRSCGNKGCKYPGPQVFALKRALRAGLKATAKIFEDGRWWFAQRKAVRTLGVAKGTLFYWKAKCPWLDGRGIEMRRLESALGRIITYYAKDDIDRILKAKAHRLPVPEVPGYVYIKDAVSEL